MLLFGAVAAACADGAADAPATPAPASPAAPAPAAAAEDDDRPAKPAVDPAAEKFWQAIKLLETEKPADQARGRALLQEAADLEFTHAQVQLADCLRFGSYGFTKSPRKAVPLYRLAAERGNAFAKLSLGQCHFYGTGVSRDRKQARTWLLAAVAADADYARPVPPDWFRDSAAKSAKGQPESPAVIGELDGDPAGHAQATAHHLLGLIYETEKNPAEAQAHLVLAATAGPAGREGIYPAALAAAMNYAFGLGVPRDMAKANEMLDRSRKLASRMGAKLVHNYVGLKQVDEFAVGDIEEEIAESFGRFQTDLQLEIAQSFANKKSKDYNPAEAVKWYEVAAESDQPWAMLSLGLMYARGDLGTPDHAKAFAWLEKAGGGEKPKHILAAANLGLCHLHGLGTPRDPAKAQEIFTRIRNRDIVGYLGATGRAPAALVSYDEAVALNETWAKTKNDPHAQYLLGVRHRWGWGVKEDAEKARGWFKRAADAGDTDACAAYGASLTARRDDLPAAVKYLEKGVAGGSVAACLDLGSLHEDRRIPDSSPIRAAELYERALDLDYENAAAHERLAYLQLKRGAGRGATPADRAVLAQRHLEEADRLGSSEAPFTLAKTALAGTRDAPSDPRKGYMFMERAAERGNIEARYQLGVMHESGIGVPVTYAEAAHHYRIAALENHREALRRLSLLYLSGKGVSQDFDRAAIWLYRLAQSGEYKALVAMGDVAMQKKEYAEAVKLWKVLVDFPDRVVRGYANERLGQCYDAGLGVKPNPARAKKYFDAALDLDNCDALFWSGNQLIAAGKPVAGVSQLERAASRSPAACYALGQIYYFGTHIAKNESRAWDYLRRAARAGHADAQYFLAAATYNHVAGCPSLEEAIRFAAEAEATGHAKAAKLRARLEQRRDGGESAPREETAAPRST